MSISVGYPAREDEKKIISRKRIDPLSDDFVPVMDGREVIYWQEQVDKVRLEPEVEDYLLEIVTRTRSHKKLQLGVSPRGSLALCQAAKSCALLSGRDYCLPDDVKNYAVAALSHRIIPGGLSPAVEKRRTSVSVIEEILDSIPVPV